MPHHVSRYASTLVSNTYPHGYLEAQGNLKRGKCMQPHLPCCLPLYFEGILLASASNSKTPCIANICCNRTLRVLHAGAAVAWQSLLNTWPATTCCVRHFHANIDPDCDNCASNVGTCACQSVLGTQRVTHLSGSFMQWCRGKARLYLSSLTWSLRLRLAQSALAVQSLSSLRATSQELHTICVRICLRACTCTSTCTRTGICIWIWYDMHM